MKAILYNYFGSQSSVIIMPLLSALFISMDRPAIKSQVEK